MPLSRRDLLRIVGTSVAGSSLGCAIFGGAGGSKDLIVRQKEPFNAEAHLSTLDDEWTTPYSRSSSSAPTARSRTSCRADIC
jgi:hypothetical protein